MPRYKATVLIEISRKEKMKAKKDAPDHLSFLEIAGEEFSFEVSSINAEEAHRKATNILSSGVYASSVKGRPSRVLPIDEKHHRLADSIKEAKRDDDLFYLGYRCIGKMEDVYPSLPEEHRENYYRTWIWENDGNERVAVWDVSNGWIDFMCDGTVEGLNLYFQNQPHEAEGGES
jgi:hypothetical protein